MGGFEFPKFTVVIVSEGIVGDDGNRQVSGFISWVFLSVSRFEVFSHSLIY